MKKVLFKKCSKPLAGQQKSNEMLIIGKEMFDKAKPKREISIYKVKRNTGM